MVKGVSERCTLFLVLISVSLFQIRVLLQTRTLVSNFASLLQIRVVASGRKDLDHWPADPYLRRL